MVDRRGRKYLTRLASGKLFETHIGNVPHDEVIGLEYGARVTTSRGHRMLAVKPTMAEFVLDMPRIATVNYPKDIGAILVHGDIFPGARVLEAGSGSGGMTIALARAVGESGRVISYDIREDMIARARENVAAIVPNADWVTFKLGDVYLGFDESDIDRVFLDLAEPWQIVSNVSESLTPGGILISFLPSITQVHDLTKALRAQRTFEMIPNRAQPSGSRDARAGRPRRPQDPAPRAAFRWPAAACGACSGAGCLAQVASIG